MFFLKKLKEDANMFEKLDLVKEALSLNSFNHPNLIKFYGVILEKIGINEPKYIVLEFMNTGDLLAFIRANRNNNVS